MAPQITLYHLQASRSIRIAWLLEELNLPYELKAANREGGLAPPAFRQEAGALGKFPSLKDGDTWVYESGNIAEYLCDMYDKENRLLAPVGDPRRYAQLQWVHAAEATYALHGIGILYARWHQQGGDVEATEARMSKNVVNDMEYLERELGKSEGRWLGGKDVGVADTVMGFSVEFVLKRGLGIKGKRFERVESYWGDIEKRPAYQKAVERTGYTLG